jgi:NADPH:quinone reductase-like Zn-dependent oxidoreductase
MNNKVIVSAYGNEDVLKMVQEPQRIPEKDELLIQVEAAGVSLGDIMRRKGVFMGMPIPPFTPGYDIVGRIIEKGDQVTRFGVGDRVAVCLDGIGGYSQYVSINEEEAVPVPDSLNSHEAVCLVLNYVTAYQLLTRAVKKEELHRILIHGAAGGVGTAMLELGQMLGIEMIGTASESKLPTVRSYGAWAIDYRAEDFVQVIRDRFPEGIDAVFDPIGGDNWHQSAQTLKNGGALIGFGFTSALTVQPRTQDANHLQEEWVLLSQGQWQKKFVQASMYSITKWKKEHPDWFHEDLSTLFEMLSEKRLKPILYATLPLKEVAEAHRLLEKSKVVGKITLDCRS